MPASPLHGLNLIQPDSPQDSASGTTSNPQADLLAAHHFPDLAAQLDLWSTLNFQSDERGNVGQTPEDKDEDDGEPDGPGPASLEGHVNAVNPSATTASSASSSKKNTRNNNANNTENATHPQLAFPGLPPLQPGMDMNSILASFGIDPYLVPQVQPTQAPTPNSAQNAASASLAQLLAAYPFAHPPFLPQLHTGDNSGVHPSALSTLPMSFPTQQGATSSTTSSSGTGADAKKARSRKTSIATDPKAGGVALGETESPPSSPTSPNTPLSASTPTGLTASEDKRRRNTAASARFRMKKKEREAALERRAAELEQRVGSLERECEGLRRENGWLKGLVVGVTGASQGAVVSSQPTQPLGKRKREEVEVA